jgi:hypothetical protein
LKVAAFPGVLQRSNLISLVRTNLRERNDDVLKRLLCVAIVVTTVTVHAAGDPAALRQIAETIATVRNGTPPPVRPRAAQHLYELTHGINPTTVDDKTVADMVSLLDTPDDSVRLWVAASLGNLGRRASIAAAPKLLLLLGQVECHGKTQPSAQAIRFALARMGRKPPPPPCAPVRKDTTPSTPKAPPQSLPPH